MTGRHHIEWLIIAMVAAVLAGCSSAEEGRIAAGVRTVTRAVAVLHPTEGWEAWGTVTFSASDSGIVIRAEIRGLTPGLHGFHIHEWGDCTAPDATSAGGHFNPDASPHGAPSDRDRHVGDLGNVSADASGAAHYERTDDRVALVGPHSVIGRAVVVHAGADDLVSQPSGNAGARVACGVIGLARESTGT